MIQQVAIKNDEENPFDENFVEIDVPRKTKIYCSEYYVKEAYDMYMMHSGDLSYEEPRDGETVTAIVSTVKDNMASLEINSKYSLSINLEKEDKKYLDQFVIGNEIKVKLNKKDGVENFNASITDAIKDSKFTEIMGSIGEPVAYKAKVEELIHGGYMLTIDGIEVFMPGSLGGMNKLWNFEKLLKKEIIVMPINFSKDKGTIVVSHREYLKTLLPGEILNLKQNMNKEYSGFVTGTSKFGIFVEFNDCVTGLIPFAELNENWKKSFNNGIIKPGNEIDFLIKDIINEKKVILTQIREDKWKDIDKKYPPLTVVKGNIKKVVNYGVFIELEEGIYGMLHLKNEDPTNYTEGEDIEVRVSKIDIENKKIYFAKK